MSWLVPFQRTLAISVVVCGILGAIFYHFDFVVPTKETTATWALVSSYWAFYALTGGIK